jgi:hypothetical protein
MIRHGCQDIGEPGLRIDVVELGGLTAAARRAPSSEPANSHDFRPDTLSVGLSLWDRLVRPASSGPGQRPVHAIASLDEEFSPLDRDLFMRLNAKWYKR